MKSTTLKSFLNNGGYSHKNTAIIFGNGVIHNCFEQFMESIILQLKRNGRIRTSETYISALKSFKHFRKNLNTPFHIFNSDLMIEYETWLMQRGVTMNTVSFYMRILRAVHTRAIEKELTPPNMPFKHVYTGIGKTTKRAISLQAIKKIKNLDLTACPTREFARDLFLFSFYTRGMSFIDIAYLKKKDLKNGVLTYTRKKTGQKLSIKWERCMQEIVSRYSKEDSEYLLPIIVSNNNERRQYLNRLKSVNNNLKAISNLANITENITLYVARHSWASIAKKKNIPLAIISEGMGHDSQNTTQIYLASLENSLIDQANRQILNSL